MSEKSIRVRYAPSPTGYLHIGGARSALFNYLYAKKYGGKLIFRSEDTDIERNVAGGEKSQYDDLVWLGIVPDESPFAPDPKYAPYRQTERLDIYRRYAEQLVREGKAYYCYCTEAELEQRKQEQLALGIRATRYDGACRHLSREQEETYRAAGRLPCIRLRLPEHRSYAFDDMVRGRMTFCSDDVGGDFVIMKSNGIPTYNFAVVIDDHLMEITHVLRGEEHLSNTPKQLAVYDAFSWEPPRFGHMTIIVNKDGKKLSKRNLDVLQFMSQYREKGYLKEAIVNYLLLLGWNGGDTREIYSLEEAVEAFDPSRLSCSPTTFDPEKMRWVNACYIRKLSDDAYLDFIRRFMARVMDVRRYDDRRLFQIADMFRKELSCGEDICAPLQAVVHPEPYTASNEAELTVCNAAAGELEKLELPDAENVRSALKEASKKCGIKGKDFYMPIRMKLTGMAHGIELYNIIGILGIPETVQRLKNNG